MPLLIAGLIACWCTAGQAKSKKCATVAACVEACKKPPGKLTRCLGETLYKLPIAKIIDGLEYTGEPAALRKHVRTSLLGIVGNQLPAKGASTQVKRLTELWHKLGPDHPQTMSIAYGLAQNPNGRPHLLTAITDVTPLAGIAACALSDATSRRRLSAEQRQLVSDQVWKQYLLERQVAPGTANYYASNVILSARESFRDRLTTLILEDTKLGILNDADEQLAVNLGSSNPDWSVELFMPLVDDPSEDVRNGARWMLSQLYSTLSARHMSSANRQTMKEWIEKQTVDGAGLTMGNSLALVAGSLYDASGDPCLMDAFLEHLDHENERARINAANFLAARIEKDTRITDALVAFVTEQQNPKALDRAIVSLAVVPERPGARRVLSQFLLSLDGAKLANPGWHGTASRAAHGYELITKTALGMSTTGFAHGNCGNSFLAGRAEVLSYELLGLEVPAELREQQAPAARPTAETVAKELREAIERIRQREKE